jgi:hypothetical protein
MAIPKFDEKELRVVGEIPGLFGDPIPMLNYPATLKEAVLATYARKPIWQLAGGEIGLFNPKLIPDNIARAMIIEADPLPFEECGGKDMFGVEWEYMPEVRGSMVRPGAPMLDDANEWYDKLVWPDIDSWDWENSRKANEGYWDPSKQYAVNFLTGWFERLISFMDFAGAIMALVDEDQNKAVHDLFDKLTDFYIRIFDRFTAYFPQVGTFAIHDDWGGQKETFFSPEVVREMIVPYMKRVTDYLHSKGKLCELHSCGNIIKQVPNMIAASWDSWIPQHMNDTHKIYELYGDKLIVAVIPEQLDLKTTSADEQRIAARRFAEKFCNKDAPCTVSHYAGSTLTPAFREELYKQSRIRFSR